MCTIGAIITKQKRLLLFKNLDLTFHWDFPQPITKQIGDMQALIFPSFADKPGLWAGINRFGLGIYGADGDAIFNRTGPEYGSPDLIRWCYQETLEQCRSVKEAYPFLINLYREHKIGCDGDIILLADPTEAVALEYAIERWGLQFSGPGSYIFRTNLYTTLPHYAPMDTENSRYMSHRKRFETLFDHLSRKSWHTDVDDLKAMLRDHTHGPGALSLCRHGGEGEFYTQASNIMVYDQGKVDAYYILNNAPCKQEYEHLHVDWRP